MMSDKNLKNSEKESVDDEKTLDINKVGRDQMIGDYLKSEREKKGFGLDKISRDTRINLTMLEYLESNSFEKLPNKAYVAGYIKSYAKILGLDQEKCLDLWRINCRALYGEDESNVSNALLAGVSESTSFAVASYWKIAAMLIVIVVGIFVYRNFRYKNEVVVKTKELKTAVLTSKTPLKSFAKPLRPIVEPKVKVIEPVTREISSVEQEKKEVTTVAKIPEEKKNEAITAETKKVVKAEKPKVIEKKVTEKEQIKKEENLKLKTKKIDLRPMPTGTYELLSVSEDSKQYLPARIKSATLAGKQNLFISAVDGETWLTYKKDKDKPRKIFLKKGGTLFIQGNDLRVFFGNITVTKIFLNGKMVSVASDRGVRSLVFPVKNISKRKLPLFVYLADGTVMSSDDYVSKLSESSN